jgi:hypothetical protein
MKRIEKSASITEQIFPLCNGQASQKGRPAMNPACSAAIRKQATTLANWTMCANVEKETGSGRKERRLNFSCHVSGVVRERQSGLFQRCSCCKWADSCCKCSKVVRTRCTAGINGILDTTRAQRSPSKSSSSARAQHQILLSVRRPFCTLVRNWSLIAFASRVCKVKIWLESSEVMEVRSDAPSAFKLSWFLVTISPYRKRQPTTVNTKPRLQERHSNEPCGSSAAYL